ncbi:hypothetical protein [Streptomyces sp. NPDC005322]|uniref:hypothetical protein n=1 Tax=Streptomyces sp. NPDC005322 TaxID=3157032 RepID=UPI0033BD524B
MQLAKESPTAESLMRLQCTDIVNGQQMTARVPLRRELWEGTDDAGREEWRTIVRYRFGCWVREETGVRVPDEHLDALPVTVV